MSRYYSACVLWCGVSYVFIFFTMKGAVVKTLVIISQKGGAGKTTLAVNLAAAAELAGLPTILIDLDPQGSSRVWAEQRGGNAPEVLSDHPKQLPALISKAEQAGAGLVIVDTAPNADQSALIAARAADLIVIPCRPSVYDLAAILASVDLTAIAKKPHVAVINAAPIQGDVANDARANLGQQGVVVSPVIVHQRAAFPNSAIVGRGVQEYEPRGKASLEIAELFKDVAKRAGLPIVEPIEMEC
ncbi:AAA family ATPase [Acidiphilium acidophilum]|uniref:AAA family ATPase n=1 Tax=Acidiphilium acidophilum TaxID=76588 RepID=UPI002E8E666B|nr:AAA family ATPase [Acidiphilium acidophilum]